MRSCILAAALGLVLAAAVPCDAETARGTVFRDENGNGARDPGEPGLAGVSVSNGSDVVRTGDDGAWELAVEPGTIVFVTKPSDHMVPLDADNLPQFFYRHYPEGTDPELELRYAGVAPTGPLPAAIDFPLVPRPEPARFDVILFADTQPQTDREIDYIRDDVIAELVGTDAAFGITAGDVAFDDLSLLPRLARVVGAAGIPWYHAPGNHELNFMAPDDARSLETFKRVFGPAYFSFDHAGAHFVILDSVHYEGRDAGREQPHLRGIGSYHGRFGERQLRWLERDLAHVPDDALVVLVMHIPLRSSLDPEVPRVNVADREDFFEVLAGREHLLVLAGHLHLTEHQYFGLEDGFAGPGELHAHTLATVSGSWWSGPVDARGIPVSYQRDGTPNGWHVLTVDGNRPTIRFRAAGAPADRQLRVVFDTSFHGYGPNTLRDHRHGELVDPRLAAHEVASTRIVVNLFDGGPRSRVSVDFGDGAERALAHERRADPFIQELFARERDQLKDWVRPRLSTHLWTGRLPPDLGPGPHRVTVRAVDEYGQEHVHRLVLEIDP